MVGVTRRLTDVLRYLNTVHPTIKFTAASSRTEIPFLDILIKVRNGLLHTDLHIKPTDTHNYLHYLSAHPRHCKDDIPFIPFSQFLRARRLCSQDEDFRARCLELTQHLRERDDPTDIITTELQRVKQLPRAKTLQYKLRANTHRVPFIITYNPRSPPFRHWFKELLPHLHSSTRIQQAVPEAPILGERNSRSLRNMLMPSALPPSTDDHQNPGCFACGKARCVVCACHLVQTTTFISATTSETSTVRNKLTCETSNLIYMLFCSKCPQTQYIGETKKHA